MLRRLIRRWAWSLVRDEVEACALRHATGAAHVVIQNDAEIIACTERGLARMVEAIESKGCDAADHGRTMLH